MIGRKKINLFSCAYRSDIPLFLLIFNCSVFNLTHVRLLMRKDALGLSRPRRSQ